MRHTFFAMFALVFLGVGFLDFCKGPSTPNQVTRSEPAMTDRAVTNDVVVDSITFLCIWPPSHKSLENSGDEVPRVVEMNRWEYDYGEGGTVYPDKFDVVISVRNLQPFPRKVLIRGSVAFKVGQISEYFGYRNEINGGSKQSEVPEKLVEQDFLKSTPWSVENEVVRQSFQMDGYGHLTPILGEINLAGFLQPFFQANDGSWPFVMRTTILIEDEYGNLITHRERNLEIMPAD